MKRIILFVALAALSVSLFSSCAAVGEISDAIESKLEDAIEDAVNDAIEDAVSDAIEDAVNDALDESENDAQNSVSETETKKSESETLGGYEEEEEWEGPII